MKKTLLLLNSFICLSVFAQNPADYTRFHFYWGFGAVGQNFSALNNRLATYPGYVQLAQVQEGLNGGWIMEENKAVFDFHFSIEHGTKGDNEKANSQLTSFAGMASLGYNFSANKYIRFYPLAGAGMEAFNARLVKDVSSIPFDSVITSSTTLQKTSPVTFANSFFAYSLGAGIDFFSKHSGKAFGIRAGYVGGFSSHTWRINDNQLLTNAPSDKLQRWSVGIQLMIRSKHMEK